MSTSLTARQTSCLETRHHDASPRAAALKALGVHSINARLPEITRKLGTAGIATVYIRYSAATDDPCLKKIRYLSGDGNLLKPNLDLQFISLLGRFFHDLIENRHPCWSQVASASGHFVWDLSLDMVHHVHRSR